MTYIATGTLMRVPTSDIAVSHPLSRVREPLLSCHSLMSCVLVSCVLVSCADTTILAAHNAPAVTALMMSRFIFVSVDEPLQQQQQRHYDYGGRGPRTFAPKQFSGAARTS